MSKPKPNLRAVFSQEPAVRPAPAEEATAPAAAVSQPVSIPPAQPKAGQGGRDRFEVLIKLPKSLHKDLKTVALADDTHITTITERLLRQFLVSKGYTQHAPD